METNKKPSQKQNFGPRSRRNRVLTRRHTPVFRGVEARVQHRDWAKRFFETVS
jgi:hypothetical protein